jgi:hypothetical protein
MTEARDLDGQVARCRLPPEPTRRAALRAQHPQQVAARRVEHGRRQRGRHPHLLSTVIT